MIHSEAAARGWLEQQPEWNAEARERIELLIALLTEENARSGSGTSSIRRSCWHMFHVKQHRLGSIWVLARASPVW
jgi:uncharacterized damage-inducible protein DinB